MVERISDSIPVVDLFAGPGGLGEGFAAVGRMEGRPRFHVALSVENDRTAHQTLELRSFFRQFDSRDVPEDYYGFVQGRVSREDLFSRCPEASEKSRSEALLATLGGEDADLIDRRVGDAYAGAHCWVLLGGPPCQAYSLVGRSRNRGNAQYRAEGDPRFSLYRAYLDVIARHWPPIFVMENVKGLLSARFSDELIFRRILSELSAPGTATGRVNRHRYRIHSLEEDSSLGEPGFAPSDLVVRAENHGIPQARHRVILLGIRDDIEVQPATLAHQPPVTARQVLDDLPKVRSGLSREPDSPDRWLGALRSARNADWAFPRDGLATEQLPERLREVLDNIEPPAHGRGGEFVPHRASAPHLPPDNWFVDERLGGVCNHRARGHMVEDLHRYLYAACYADLVLRSPTLHDFPAELLPNHKSVASGHFRDRFRVQLRDEPARTITSHIAKDGHYYIHYDPHQCRGLTVREAARLQTFPDNYFFCGPRTSQYAQVGNAVPPYLAMQIGAIVLAVLQDAGVAG